MAFNPALLVKLQPSSLFTDPATIPNVAVSPLVPQQWLYNGNADTVGTIMGAGYFNVFANWTNTLEYNNGQFFRVGDSIYIVASDGNAFIQVVTVGATITTGSLPPGPLSVVNADVAANAAIDFSKLAALTSGHILVGSAGNVATSVVMSGDVAIIASGATTIQAGAVTGSKIAATTITGANVAATTIAGSNLIANTVASSQLDTTTIQYVKVPVTAAQWNGMYAAPFQLIAAPAAGKLIIVDDAVLEMTFVSAQYAGGGVVALQYDSTVHGAGTAASATIAAATINGYAASSNIGIAGTMASSASSTTIAKGLFISNDTGAFTTGDSTWNIHIAYRIVTA